MIYQTTISNKNKMDMFKQAMMEMRAQVQPKECDHN